MELYFAIGVVVFIVCIAGIVAASKICNEWPAEDIFILLIILSAIAGLLWPLVLTLSLAVGIAAGLGLGAAKIIMKFMARRAAKEG